MGWYIDRLDREHWEAMEETGYPPPVIRMTRNAMRELCIELESYWSGGGSDPPTAIRSFMGSPVVLIENEE